MTDTITLPRELTDEIAEAICKEARCCGGIAFDIWEAIVAASLVSNGWVRCSDRLPDFSGLVITKFDDGREVYNSFTSGEWQFFKRSERGNNIYPTHWRPLPTPPAAPLDH